MKTLKNFTKKISIYLTVIATVLWSINFSLLMPTMPANAATIIPSVTGLLNGYFSGAPIKVSSDPTAIVKIAIKASASGKLLQAVTVNFSGTGTFATTTLANIAANTNSGVALYNDAGGSADSYDATDVLIATSTGWTSMTSNIILTPQPAISISTATSTFYVVIRTSSTAANNDQIIATIPTNGITTNDSVSATGPSANFTANSFRVDAVAPTILSVTGNSGSNDLTVSFSEPVQKIGGGNLTANQFTFVDHGTITTHSTSTAAHMAGQVFATVTLTGIDSGDFADGGNGISTLAAAVNGITDMAGNVMATTPVNLTAPVTITTATIPSTYSGATYTAGSPLVSFTASGASGTYTWATSSPADDTLLQSLGLTVNSAGKLFATSTVSSKTGNYNINFKATDASDPTASSTKYFQINVAATSGGSMPYISSVTPGGSATSSTATLTISGSNTNFSGSSVVEFFLSPEVSGTNGITVGAITANSQTSLAVPITVTAAATSGSRDLKITTGSQIVFMSHAFSIFGAAAGSGLALNLPTDGATGVSISPPPNFSFNASVTAGVNSYRVTVKPNSDFSGTALWDYVFPTYALSSSSHCNGLTCNLSYGAGQFMILTQPTSLAPNTAYYWNVRTYSQMPNNVNDTAIPLDSAIARGFTTSASVNDSVSPTIFHRPIFSAQAGAALNVFARVMDNFARANTTPALTTTLVYCTTTGCTPSSSVNGAEVGNGYFKYVIPGGAVGATGSIVRYWLSASDGTNTAWLKGPSDAPFQLTTMGTGGSTITGTVTDSASAALAGATVFAEGTGFNATSGADGTYTLSNLPQGNYDLIAVKAAYADRSIQGVQAGTTGINFSLPSGGGGGFGGDTTKPRINFTGPPDGMSGIPGADSNFKIFVGFSKAMAQTPFTTAGNIYVKELNPATGAITDITTTKGGWTYYPTSPGGSLPPGNNLAVWSFSTGQTFGDNKTILVIITPNITDTANNSINGNQPDGSYAFSFTTGMMANFSGFNSGTGTFSGGGTFGSGAFTPPYVTGSTPTPGSFDVPVNQKIVINFSEAMADDAGAYSLKNYIKPYTLSGANPPYAETAVSSGSYTVSLDTSKKIATVTITGNMAVSTRYRVKVLGGAKASSGMTLSPPGQEANQMFMTEFKTSSSATGDITAPAITGLYPAGGASAVSVSTGAVNVGFNKDMDASTITTNNFYLSIGSTAVNGTVDYRPSERQAYFLPKNSLNATTTYTINLSASVLALNSQALTATTSIFTTGGPDNSLPTVSFINADDYSLAITFSKPMNAAKAVDTLNYASSTLKSSLYTIKQGTAGNAQNGTTVTLGADASLSYDAITNTVIIKGVSLTAGNEVYVSVYAVKDSAGNVMTTGNTAKATVQSSSLTKGALGPMAMSTDAFSMGGGFTPTNFSGSTFGFAPPIEVRPFSMMADKTTTYHLSLPISKQITAGGTVVLTFPTGFDISSAKQDTNSPMRSDLNGPGAGTIRFKCQTSVTNGKTCPAAGGATVAGDTAADTSTMGGLADDGVTVNATARTITITLSADTNSEGHDFLNLDIAGIKNSAIPKDFNTTGYTVDIKTKNSTTLLESLTSQPFFIQAGGAYAISGTITATGLTDGTGSTTKIYLMSPMTGPTETTVTFTGTDAPYSFTGLAAGEYFLFTDQSIPLGTKEYIGKAMPERIGITNASVTYNITLNNADVGTAVTISVKGPANEPIDIFASSPTGFKAKSVTLDGDATNYDSITLKLTDGKWMIGVGPQMPKGPMAGPPTTPTYISPQPVNITVQSAGSPIVVENSGTANDGTVQFALTSASKYIKGTIQDGAGKVMANAEVYAYSPQGGMGSHGQTATDGTFSLGVIDGSYVVGSFVPGMPPSKEVPVIVTSDTTTYLLIDGSATAITAAAAQTSFVLKIAKPDYTISGKITDGTNVVQGANVYAYRSDGPGHANANTDSSGNYTLYVSNGTWKVGVFLPQYGQLTEQTVSISGSSASNQNFSPSSTGTFNNVSGTVTVGGTAKQGAFVRLNGNNTSNEAITGSDGKYSFKVPQGSGYVIKLFIPGMGEASTTAAFNVTGDVTGKDFAIGAANTITILTSSSVTKAAVELMATNGVGGRAEITNATSTSLSLPNGSYRVQVNIPGLNLALTAIAGTTVDTAYATTTGTGIITVNGNESLTITLPTLRTVSGTTSVGDAWVEIVNPSGNIHFGAKSASTTPYSFSLQVVDSATDYIINAMKPGYYRDPSTLTVNGANKTNQTLTLTASTLNISGRVYIGSSGAANAFVRAEKQGAGFSGTQADASGNFSLPVTAGTWKIYAVAEGYAETAYSANPIIITTSSVSGKDITLSATVALNPPKSKPITPSSGGTLDDPDAGVKLTIPANALGQSSSAGNIQVKETNNVRSTSNSIPVNGKAMEIKATDSSGNPITTLSDSVTVEISYSTAELAATPSASDSSINTKAEADKLQSGYWDETTANWVILPSTITYYGSDGTVLDSSDAGHTPAANLSNVATTTVSTATTHFSNYAPISSTEGAPGTPSGLTTAVQSATRINLSWTAVSGAVSYDIYRSSSESGTYSRIGSEPTTTNTSYSDTGLTAGTAYYYKVSAINASGESAASGSVPATTQSAGGAVIAPTNSGIQTSPNSAAPATPTTTTTKTPTTTTTPAPTATTATTNPTADTTAAAPTQKLEASEIKNLIKADVKTITDNLGIKRDLKAETAALKQYVKALIAGQKKIDSKKQAALNYFITYGTASTVKLSRSERAEVLQSYKSAFNKIPLADKQWQDVINIANNQAPMERNKATEANSIKAFKKIYQRLPDLKNAADNQAVMTIAYGLKPTQKNPKLEAEASKKFKAIYGYAPKSITAMNIVKAMAYSGAKK